MITLKELLSIDNIDLQQYFKIYLNKDLDWGGEEKFIDESDWLNCIVNASEYLSNPNLRNLFNNKSTNYLCFADTNLITGHTIIHIEKIKEFTYLEKYYFGGNSVFTGFDTLSDRAIRALLTFFMKEYNLDFSEDTLVIDIEAIARKIHANIDAITTLLKEYDKSNEN